MNINTHSPCLYKSIIIIALNAFIFTQTNGQLPNWTSGANPSWTSSNPTTTHLNWQANVSSVSTNAGEIGYTHNQNSTYTSPNYTNFQSLCPNSTRITVQPTLFGRLENNFDFLHFEYSTNNGTSWTNLGTWTGDPINTSPTYTITIQPNMRFRFRFQTDGSVNSYCQPCGWFPTTHWYYVDILNLQFNCLVVLNTDLIEFNGTRKDDYNELYWTTNNSNIDKYLLEYSDDGYEWNILTETVDNSFQHSNYLKDNYYKLNTINNDGEIKQIGNIIYIDRDIPEIVKITNLLGQEVNDSYTGLVIITYSNGDIIKTYKGN